MKDDQIENTPVGNITFGTAESDASRPLNISNIGSVFPSNQEVIESVTLVGGKIETISKIHPEIQYWTHGYNVQAIKRVYCAKDGEIVLEKEIHGTVIPPQTAPERIEWNEPENPEAQ